MSRAPAMPPSPEEALRLHRHLLDGDPTASRDLAEAFLEPLIGWLSATNRRAPPELCEEAAASALITLIQNPQSFSPPRQSLEVYLRLSARGDLRNLLARERKHTRGRVPWAHVEHSPDAGKYLGRADDPSLPLQLDEALRQAAAAVPPAVWEGLSEVEQQVLKLMLQKERQTAVYAQVCGWQSLPFAEQRRHVKRLKDRLQKRLERAGEIHDQSPRPPGPAGDQ